MTSLVNYCIYVYTSYSLYIYIYSFVAGQLVLVHLVVVVIIVVVVRLIVVHLATFAAVFSSKTWPLTAFAAINV